MSYRRALARGQVWGLLHDIDQGPPAFLAPGTDFMEDKFSMDWGWGVVSGLLKCITCIVHFISIIITSAPPQIIRH